MTDSAPFIEALRVALGSVDGAEGLDDPGKADGVSGLCELLAELFGQGCNLVEAGGPIPVKGLGKLPHPVRRGGKLIQYGRKLFIIKAKKRQIV